MSREQPALRLLVEETEGGTEAAADVWLGGHKRQRSPGSPHGRCRRPVGLRGKEEARPHCPCPRATVVAGGGRRWPVIGVPSQQVHPCTFQVAQAAACPHPGVNSDLQLR